jgi:hypothetical protein
MTDSFDAAPYPEVATDIPAIAAPDREAAGKRRVLDRLSTSVPAARQRAGFTDIRIK